LLINAVRGNSTSYFEILSVSEESYCFSQTAVISNSYLQCGITFDLVKTLLNLPPLKQTSMRLNLNSLIRSGAILMAVASIATSCKSKKNAATPIEKSSGAVEISVPFSSKEYYSDKENFRAKSSGSSPDLQTAKKIALQNAKSEMAGLIQTTVKKVTDQYTQQRTIDNKTEFNNKFEELAREVTNQELVDVRVMGEKLFKEPNNSFTYWVAIEANKQAVLNGINKAMSNNQKLSQDYDKKKFEEVFNAEMDKLAKERSGN
jgi:hypothetical protein